MIQQQIRPWEVVDKRVLEVMQALPREAFVPDAYLGLAYADIEIPIGNAQTMMAPKVVGRMLQALAPKSTDRALEIGTGTGYVTACLGRMCRTVVSIELDPELAAAAAKTLVGLDIAGLDLRTGDALADRIEGGPFDVIAVTGSLPSEEPLAQLQAHLAPAGRLFVVTGEAPVMEAWLISRIGEDDFRRQSLFETALTALVGVPEPEHFRF
jgi:protein-L-isoaspartate(D-aspartate) O-methyltransferase